MSTTTVTGGWHLQGNAADAYEAYLVPAIFDAMSRRLVATTGVRPGDRVLDVACGTGVVARAAAAQVGSIGSVVGIDLNPDMLATAARAAADMAPPIRWQQADAVDLPFADDTFDVALCEEAVQFLPDRLAALRELHRVTAPGGRLGFSVLRSLDRNPAYRTFARALGEHAGADAEVMMKSPFAFDDGEALRDLTRQAGFTDVVVRIAVSEERFPSVPEFVRREAASSPLAGPLGALGDDRRAALVASLERDLAPHVDDLGLAFANETHLVTARA